jgi:undecaprenyl-diphosphatase
MDQTLFHLINEKWTSPALDLFMAAVSDIEIWKPFLILIGLCLLVWGGFRGRAFVFCLVISLLITDQVTSSLKKAINRHRPKQVQSVRMVGLQKARPEFLTLFKKPNVHLSTEADRKSSGPSFPSGHMTNNTVIAMCCTLFYRRRGAFYWIITAAIGYSRIYLGAHWPSDVLGTFFLAAGETLLIVGGLELLWRWAAEKWLPKIYERYPSLIFDANGTS